MVEADGIEDAMSEKLNSREVKVLCQRRLQLFKGFEYVQTWPRNHIFAARRSSTSLSALIRKPIEVSHVRTGPGMHGRVDLVLTTQYAHAFRLTPSRAKRPQVEFDPYIQIILQSDFASTET